MLFRSAPRRRSQTHVLNGILAESMNTVEGAADEKNSPQVKFDLAKNQISNSHIRS